MREERAEEKGKESTRKEIKEETEDEGRKKEMGTSTRRADRKGGY